ncbi:dienelactone hydrolase family protein [Candidatus Woesearchaeota archaeon]|nr:dienelactone hydrolase family protein [Candidatus Woesearchaeota archaeon]
MAFQELENMNISKKKLKLLVILLTLIILSAMAYFYIKQKPYYIDSNHYLHYPLQRVAVSFSILSTNETANFTEQKLTFTSKDISIYGLLYTPKSAEHAKLPAIVILPGGGVRKEDEARVARFAASHGFVAFTFDQRGVGETGSIFPSLDRDYQTFLMGKEPVQHLVIYDALSAVDLVKQMPYVDKGNVLLMGESMGGRFTAVAAALDPGIKAAIIVSSAGYGPIKTGDAQQQAFLDSINPDHYIALIAPRPVYFLHGQNDTTIPVQNAQYTYSLANQPKQFIYVENCGHGLCDNMMAYFAKVLEELR